MGSDGRILAAGVCSERDMYLVIHWCIGILTFLSPLSFLFIARWIDTSLHGHPLTWTWNPPSVKLHRVREYSQTRLCASTLSSHRLVN